jgi:hypothetical protein
MLLAEKRSDVFELTEAGKRYRRRLNAAGASK